MTKHVMKGNTIISDKKHVKKILLKMQIILLEIDYYIGMLEATRKLNAYVTRL